jgi:hypothetical protein
LNRYLLHIILFVFGSTSHCFGQDDVTVPVLTEDTVGGPVVEVVQGNESKFDRIDSTYFVNQHRRIDPVKVEEIKKDKAFWYLDYKQKQKQQTGTPVRAGRWVQNLLWGIIILAFVVILILFLANSNIRIFRKSASTMDETESGFDDEDVHRINYEKELHKAVSNGDLRLAVRLLYLQTLKELSERELISYKQDRTNGDYLMQLSNTAYYREFFALTRNYEYVWYGKFPVSTGAFETIRNQFSNFKGRLPL